MKFFKNVNWVLLSILNLIVLVTVFIFAMAIKYHALPLLAAGYGLFFLYLHHELEESDEYYKHR